VIGYGERERKDLTGAISNINSDEISKSTVMNPELAMRWALGNMLTLDNNFFSSDIPRAMNFRERNLNFPIPNNEMNANPNITQNDGY